MYLIYIFHDVYIIFRRNRCRFGVAYYLITQISGFVRYNQARRKKYRFVMGLIMAYNICPFLCCIIALLIDWMTKFSWAPRSIMLKRMTTPHFFTNGLYGLDSVDALVIHNKNEKVMGYSHRCLQTVSCLIWYYRKVAYLSVTQYFRIFYCADKGKRY